VRYGETSIIVTIFTAQFGIQTYIVNGVRSKSSKSKIALFQPLTLLDLVVYYKENAAIKRIKEVKCLHPYQTLQSDVRKAAIAMFINEVLNKTLKEENQAHEFFEFLQQSFIFLDEQKSDFENFHLILLIKLCRFLGFGTSQPEEVLTGRLTGKEEEALLKNLMDCSYNDILPIRNDQRREFLEIILRFYSTHIDGFGEVKSVQVMKEVLG
jgi:DNA repair protein RecO (recombination protein O)